MKKQIIFIWMVFSMIHTGGFPAAAQQAAQPPQYRQETAPVTVHKISPHVYEVRGGDGANCAFIVGDKEVFAVDAKMSDASAREMIVAIGQTADKPISHLLLTHSDGDHVNGLGGFPETLDILSHANTAKHIAAANETAETRLPLPNETFYTRMGLSSGALQVDLYYFGPAHTDGDVVIHIPEDRVAIVGDLFFKDREPLIHMHKNGSSFGLAKVLEQIAALDAETYLSGHAQPVAKPEIETLHKRLVETQKKVKAMVDEKKSLDDVKRELGISTEESPWRSLAEVIYLELTE